jgi:hypothetical protein
MWCDGRLHQTLDRAVATLGALPIIEEARRIVTASEALKVAGNEAFSRREFDASVDRYSSALQLIQHTPNSRLKSVLLNNRAAARMHQRR